MSQIVFIDDSGDPGFKLDSGSSKHFVIACVIFDDNLEAEETALKIKRFRRSIGWSDEMEFKFNKTKKSIVEGLLKQVVTNSFRIRAICADKSLIRSHELRNKQDSFYNYMIKEVLSKTTTLSEATIKLDGHSGREYKKSAKAYFRREITSSTDKINKFKFVDSKTDSLIQLADLIAGSILRSYQVDKTDRAVYRAILQPHIEDIWDFQ